MKTYATIIALFLAGPAFANHGPGASGGGTNVISGETLKSGHFEIEAREDYSQFQSFTREQAEARAMRGGDFDSLDHGFITSTDFSYGITDDFQLGGSIGYFVGHHFASAERNTDGSVDYSTAQPEGLTDMAVIGKYHILRGQPGNLAIVSGVIIPTGRSDVRLANGEALSPTDQPGTGEFGLPIGLGYSRFLTSHLTIDASFMYTRRFEKDEFKVGDRIDSGVALAYRLTDSIKTFPQYAVFAELNDVYLKQDVEDGADDPNSGGNTLYLTPGFRVRFDPHMAFTVAPSFPIWQQLNGDQGRVDFKLAAIFSYSY